MMRGAAEQGVEADESLARSELRSLTPVLGGTVEPTHQPT
jgi:hypothetical protein